MLYFPSWFGLLFRASPVLLPCTENIDPHPSPITSQLGIVTLTQGALCDLLLPRTLLPAWPVADGCPVGTRQSMHLDMSLPVRPVTDQNAAGTMSTCCGCHAPLDTTFSSLLFLEPRLRDFSHLLYSLRYLVSGSETFYQDFYADIHPDSPQKVTDTRQCWTLFWKVFANTGPETQERGLSKVTHAERRL